MLKELFIIMGFLNDFFLILIFQLRGKNNLEPVKKIGYYYLGMIIPTIIGIILTLTEQQPYAYLVFLIIFGVYLFVEWLFDYKMEVDFRSNWKLLVPYLALYYMMNYGFIVMPWKDSTVIGSILLILFIIQILANIRSHNRIG